MPLLHYFNPGHETAVLNGSPYYMAPARILRMHRDLAFLPAWYAAPEDYIFTETPVSPDFIRNMTRRYGPFATPLSAREAAATATTMPPAVASPWGWSPQSVHRYETWKEETGWHSLVIPPYDEAYARLCARQTAALCLRSLSGVLPEPDKSLLPRFRSSLEEIEKLIAATRKPVVVKAPYSSSGRGLRWITGEITGPDRTWIAGILKKQGCVSIEPALDKQVDFAMEFFSDGEGRVSFEGLSLFHTTQQGHYTGNFVGSQEEIERRLAALVDSEWMEEIKTALEFSLQELAGHLYTGYIGVDMLIYKNERGAFRLHPCVEINMRRTMGTTALHISRHRLAPGNCGQFRIEYCAGPGEAYAKHLGRAAAYPEKLQNGKLQAGYLALCPVTETTRYTAFLLVNPG
ncbi:MAG: hypothetical protein LIP00_10425 [Parabacteroides sp.]|nr:hypothetical protein [Parabacteroides sp.]